MFEKCLLGIVVGLGIACVYTAYMFIRSGKNKEEFKKNFGKK